MKPNFLPTIRLQVAFISLAAVLLSSCPASAFWIWTPQTKKWINPKTAVKPTPQEQFAVAITLYDSKDYDRAVIEFNKLLKNYPKAAEAAESQYYLGRIEEERGKLYEAYQAYQKVVSIYPFSSRIQEMIEREYKIGEAFMSGQKRKALGVALPFENPAIEIFTKVVENSNFGPYAAQAQYKLGLVFKGAGRYYEAEDAFTKVVSNYPDSEWIEAAKFQIASCRAAVSRGSEYDQGAAKDAKSKFEDFVREHPDAVLSRQAEENINSLRVNEAQSYFTTARFYEKQKLYDSARLYYNDIIENYGDTPWSAKAMERMRIMDARKKK